MGYYSEVAFAIRGKKEDIIPALVTYRAEGILANDAINECTYHEDDGIVTILYRAESIKWYEHFDEVKALEGLYDFFQEIDDAKFEGCFIRIGEEADDYHEREFGESPWDMLNCSKSIYVNVNNTADDTLEKLCATPTLPTSSPT